jgi:hypothetical protein
MLCDLQRILQLLIVDEHPFPRGTTWSTSSHTVAPGCTCPCPRRAASSFVRNWFDTVMWMRLSLAVSGSTFIGSNARASGSGRLGGVSSGRNATSVSRFSHVNPSLE